jgi:hypothetical protein
MHCHERALTLRCTRPPNIQSSRREAEAYEKAADDELALSISRLLLPGEDIDGLMDRILK